MESTHKYLFSLLITLLTACGGSGSDQESTKSDNFAPIIEDPGLLTHREGQKFTVKIKASDSNNDPINYFISAGVDKALFVIDNKTGDLAFTVSPDYELPSDSNKDNQYHLTVSASDGKKSDSIDLTVKVIDALEGRVVDGPMSGSTVFVDLNGDSEQNADEPSGVTDKDGFFIIELPEINAKITSKGGTDSATNVKHPKFVLIADIPQSSSISSVYVSPISTVLAKATSNEDKEALLIKLGIKDGYETVLATDYWAKAQAGDKEAMQVQRKNQIIGLMMQTASSLKIDKSDSNPSLIIANSLVMQDEIDLTRAENVRNLIKTAASAVSLSLEGSKLTAVANSVATINAVIANPDLNPTDNTAKDITAIAQQALQANIKGLIEGEITVDKFNSENSNLLSNINVPEGANDTDKDGFADFIDPDDDNDGVLDINDAFPLDSSESLDTDGDGIGNNADTDDDNDGVPDSRDPFPVNGDKTPPTASISADHQSGSAPLVVNFDAGNSIAGNDQNSIQSYLWDFGNGVQASSQKAQHVYASAGTYFAQLTVVNNDGYEDTSRVSIEVSEGQASYSVSGKVSVEDNTYVDSDINDERSTVVPNGSITDFISSAQIINSVPMQLVGYLNHQGAGNDGAMKEKGDLTDVFKIEASGGEVITLHTPNASSGEDSSLPGADLDLFLYSEDGTYIDSSMNPSGDSEVISLPDLQGSYFIMVGLYTDEDHSNLSSSYKLAVDNSTVIAQASTMNWSNSAEFVIGDIIVKRNTNCKFKPLSDLIGSKAISPLQQKGSRSGPSLYSYGDRIVDLVKSAKTNKSIFTHFGKGQSKPSETELKIATLMMAKDIGSHSCVEYAEPNYRRNKLLTPNDAKYNEQWHYDKINLPSAWDTTTGNETIKVAVLDTGIAPNHPDFNLKHTDDGYDFVSDAENSADGDGLDSDPTDSCYDSHGTHVAGTVGAITDNGEGVAGVDWRAKIMSLRVLGCSGGTDYDIAQGIRYAAGLQNDSGVVVSRADVINMSLGGPYSDQVTMDAITDAVNAGVIVIAAAGNESTSLPSYPAAYEGVISVSASGKDNQRADFSNYGSTVDVAAPGVEIMSTVVRLEDETIIHDYAPLDGTSMASPHIAGVVSLMKSVYSGMKQDDFEAILISGNITEDLGDSGRDDIFGFGLIDAKKAVEYAKQINDGSVQIPVTPVLGINYSSIDFASTINEAVVKASNIGSKGSTVTISDIEVANSFVTVDRPSSSDGLGDYTIRIDRTDLSPGTYNSSVKFLSNGGDKILSVVFRVLDPNQRYYGNAGNIYLHLTNIDTGEISKINISQPTNGEYAFNFPFVAAGKYTLKAGNDLDNNGFLCQGAEGCGHYDGNVEAILEIDGDKTGINFDLNY